MIQSLSFRTMNNSESARKLNQAVNNTGRAVGEALSQAKGAFSSFWSTFTAPSSPAPPAPSTEPPEIQIRVDTSAIETPRETNEPKEGVIKQIAKKIHNSDLSLRQDKETGPNQGGIVEIGREANTLDSNIKNDVFDI